MLPQCTDITKEVNLNLTEDVVDEVFPACDHLIRREQWNGIQIFLGDVFFCLFGLNLVFVLFYQIDNVAVMLVNQSKLGKTKK